VVDSYFVESASYGIGGAEPPLTELRPPVCAIAFSRASALLPAWTSTVSWKVLDTHPVRTPRTTRWAHGTTAPSTEGSPPPTRRVSRTRLHVRRRQLHGQHRPKRLSEYDWREMVNRLSSGIAEVSGNIALVCTVTVVICGEIAPVAGALSLVASAVSVATSDQTSSCPSGHSSCPEAIVSAAIVAGAGGFGVGGKVARTIEVDSQDSGRPHNTCVKPVGAVSASPTIRQAPRRGGQLT
jgi:hypothetical protein